MRLEARLSYALLGLVQATGSAGGLDFSERKITETQAKLKTFLDYKIVS